MVGQKKLTAVLSPGGDANIRHTHASKLTSNAQSASCVLWILLDLGDFCHHRKRATNTTQIFADEWSFTKLEPSGEAVFMFYPMKTIDAECVACFSLYLFGSVSPASPVSILGTLLGIPMQAENPICVDMIDAKYRWNVIRRSMLFEAGSTPLMRPSESRVCV